MMTPLKWPRLRRADIRHEAIEFLAQPRAFGRKTFRRIQHLLGGRTGLGSAAIHLHDIGGRFMGSLRDALNTARDLLGSRACRCDLCWRAAFLASLRRVPHAGANTTEAWKG